MVPRSAMASIKILPLRFSTLERMLLSPPPFRM
jgi:hypothetical protein